MEGVLPRKRLESSQTVPNAKGTRCQVHTQYEWTRFLTMSSCESYLSPGVSAVKEGSDHPTCKAIMGTRDLIWKIAGNYQVGAGESQLRGEKQEVPVERWAGLVFENKDVLIYLPFGYFFMLPELTIYFIKV